MQHFQDMDSLSVQESRNNLAEISLFTRRRPHDVLDLNTCFRVQKAKAQLNGFKVGDEV